MEELGLYPLHSFHLFAYYLAFVHPVSKEMMEFIVYPDKNDKWALFNY